MGLFGKPSIPVQREPFDFGFEIKNISGETYNGEVGFNRVTFRPADKNLLINPILFRERVFIKDLKNGEKVEIWNWRTITLDFEGVAIVESNIAHDDNNKYWVGIKKYDAPNKQTDEILSREHFRETFSIRGSLEHRQQINGNIMLTLTLVLLLDAFVDVKAVITPRIVEQWNMLIYIIKWFFS